MRTLTLSVGDELAESADCLFERIGLTTELALTLFLQRSVAEGRLPFDPTAPVFADKDHAAEKGKADKPRHNVAITHEMCERVWSVFSNNLGKSYDQHVAAERIEKETGMSAGSAFIYLVFISNLVQGKPNKRNMKMSDLEFFMGRIREELGDTLFSNACTSLRKSIPYWDRPAFGRFAERIDNYLGRMGK